ncbi:MAG: hypothetical protein PHR36_03495 [Patescibacteria group bacterium]|nr:hypothetical protein [Patescibacteria group bacterium]
MIHSAEEWARMLFVPLYQEKFLQTIWNTPDPMRQQEGWRLKSGKWSPWFFNMRPLGDSPELFFNCCVAMADLISEHEDVDVITAVEMAGINLSGGMAVVSRSLLSIPRRIAYTRPLPKKVRTPEEAAELFSQFDEGVAGYGQKEFIEGRLLDGDRVAIFDDMATNLGSKIIARLTVLWMAKQMGISVTCNKIFYFLNRERENRQRGLDFAKRTEPGLYPEPLHAHYVIEFDDHFPDLNGIMHPEEFQVISDFQRDDSGRFQDKGEQQRVLALAAKTRQD